MSGLVPIKIGPRPDPNGQISWAACNVATWQKKRQRADYIGVTFKDRDRLACLHIPDADSFVSWTAGNLLAVGQRQ